MRNCTLFVFGCLLTAMFIGCGQNSARTEVVPAFSESESIEKVRTMLTDYAKGNPMGPETADLEQILEGIKKSSPEKADLLKNGFAELGGISDKSPAFKQKAKELLDGLDQ